MWATSGRIPTLDIQILRSIAFMFLQLTLIWSARVTTPSTRPHQLPNPLPGSWKSHTLGLFLVVVQLMSAIISPWISCTTTTKWPDLCNFPRLAPYPPSFRWPFLVSTSSSPRIALRITSSSATAARSPRPSHGTHEFQQNWIKLAKMIVHFINSTL